MGILKKIYEYLGGIVVLLVTIATLVAAFYIYLWHGALPGELYPKFNSLTRADLGSLGDVVGGFLNPAISFIAVILLFNSVRLQRRELKSVVKELERTQKAHEDANEARMRTIKMTERAEISPLLLNKIQLVLKELDQLINEPSQDGNTFLMMLLQPGIYRQPFEDPHYDHSGHTEGLQKLYRRLVPKILELSEIVSILAHYEVKPIIFEHLIMRHVKLFWNFSNHNGGQYYRFNKENIIIEQSFSIIRNCINFNLSENDVDNEFKIEFKERQLLK